MRSHCRGACRPKDTAILLLRGLFMGISSFRPQSQSLSTTNPQPPPAHIILFMFVSAILAAAGRGTRLGSAIPKQMLALGGRTILQRSFDVLDSCDRSDEIVGALPPDFARTPPPYLISSRKPV